jgi:ATP synthase protein I
MPDDQRDNGPETESDFARQVGAKAARKLRLQSEHRPGVWFGLGMFGLIGWSVTVPTVTGAMLGLWIDRRHPGPHSWTLALLVAGLLIGCANAWHWMVQEDEAMTEKPENSDE